MKKLKKLAEANIEIQYTAVRGEGGSLEIDHCRYRPGSSEVTM